MAKPDPGIKKVTLRQKDIGAMYTNPDESLDKYYLRYRIISEDGTQFSRWSQTYGIDGNSVLSGGLVSGYTLLSDATTITVSWQIDDGVFGTPFDAYVRWSEDATKQNAEDMTWSAWTFASETTSSTFSTNIPSGKKWVQVYVQRQTFPKVRTNAAKIFESTVYSTRSTTDSGLVSEL